MTESVRVSSEVMFRGPALARAMALIMRPMTWKRMLFLRSVSSSMVEETLGVYLEAA